MALGAAGELFAGIEVARVLQIDRTVHLHARETVRSGQRHARIFGARGVGIAAEGGCATAGPGEQDQVADAVAVGHGREAAAALGIAHADLGVAAALGAQRGVAVFAEALVQRGRTEGRTHRGRGTPAGGEPIAIRQAARGLATELAVVVVAQVGLHGVRACRETVAQGQPILCAAARQAGTPGIECGVVDMVFAALERRAQAVRTQAPVVLPQGAAQLRFGAVGRRHGLVAADRIADRHPRAVHLTPLRGPVRARCVQTVLVAVVLGRCGLVGESVVARIEPAHEQVGANAVLCIDAVAQPRASTGAAIAIVVGVVRAAGLGVKAAAARMGQAQGIVQRALRARRAAHARFDLARALATQAHANIGLGRAFAFAGEELNDATDGVRAIDCGGGAAQHFDAFDLRKRNLLPQGTARGLRVDAHAIDIDGRKALLGTAHIHAAGIAHTAVARDLDAWQARQQIADAGGAAGFNGLAVDNGNVGHQVRQGLLRARGRDHRFGKLRGAQVLGQQDGGRSILGLCRTGGEQGKRGKDDRAQRRSTAHVGQTIFHGKHTLSKQPGPASPPAYG